ncbi:hypothetical protein P7D22_19590 [Lichenihabitans sp. Uapishka_5]|uniref:hypothetical protein n=1 Tax=Lichenihabitans sp. Uapishka_5 TaxID=3037302 RepID=UPI0029E7F8B5|nr:hypothetical protein [Lichenihabitans sp. Uapishka_5]MDX7953371.1 hypothetical protein [Lichenihabitans sp. Uapishka_5]
MTKPAASASTAIRKRVMDVEDVISWAFRDELPKRSRDRVSEPCQVSPMFRLGQYGVRIDNWHREPGFPTIMGDPHPDALKVEAAVESLARFVEMPIEDGLDLAPDLAAFGIDEHDAMRRALRQVVSTTVGFAKLRKRPYWHDKTYPMPVHTDGGRPRCYRWATMVDGTVTGGEVEYECLVPVEGNRGTYPSGSHSPLRFDPDPRGMVEERAEYAAWWAALDLLAADLSARLDTIAVLPPSAPQRPWIDPGEAPKPLRIFADLSDRSHIHRTQARQTYEAHRALGARRHISARSKEARRSAPRRTMLPVALRA